MNSGKLARCKGRERLPARDTNSSDDDDDDGAVDALSPSKKRGTKMNTTTSDFQEASKGKLEKLELIFDTYHGTMIRKKRCVRGWNLSSCCIYTFDQPRSSPSWSNSNLLKIRFFYVYNFNAKYTGYSGIHTRSHVVMKYPIRCMRTPSKEERMNVEWVLFDGGTNTLSSELRNNKEQQQQQQQINICKSFER